MATNPRMAPFSLTGSTGTDANGKPTASVTIAGIVYTASGDAALDAFQALAQRLVAEGVDPGCQLTCGASSIGDILLEV